MDLLSSLICVSLVALVMYLAIRLAGRRALNMVGALAPGFRLPDGDGRDQGLADHAGKWRVLYFYPRDDTPGCTAEACALRDEFAGFRERGIAVLGVSLDGVASHAGFTRRHRLPFPLLSDGSGTVARAYGALWDFRLLRFARRYTYLIDPDGRIARVYIRVSPRRHAAELLADVDQLKAARTRYPPGPPP